MTAKWYELESLPRVLERHRDEGRRIGLCHGTFDLLHPGHLRHLREAASLVDVLVVSVTDDPFVNKGPGRPVFSSDLRAEQLVALECVDYVAINRAETSINVIEILRPDHYIKGPDYRQACDDVTGNIVHEQRAVESVGGSIVFTDDVTFSSTSLINRYMDGLAPEVRRYTERLKRDGTGYREMEALLERARPLRVVVVGETIIDEYHTNRILGTAGKGGTPTVKRTGSELFAGGAVAVANHVGGFADQVRLVSTVGGNDGYGKFVEERIAANVRATLLPIAGEPTLRKTRHVDEDGRKLFEVYHGGDGLLAPDAERCLMASLQDVLAGCDLVLVPDFGNGMISDGVAAYLSERAPFIAVNTQLNAGNRGFHDITRYPKADFVSLNEQELRLAARSRHGQTDALMASVQEQLGAQHVAVTRGPEGALLRERKSGEVTSVPALSNQVVDAVGAGDAFLSLAALAFVCGGSAAAAGLVGSAAGALNAQTVCNREPVSKGRLLKYLQTLLK